MIVRPHSNLAATIWIDVGMAEATIRARRPYSAPVHRIGYGGVQGAEATLNHN